MEGHALAAHKGITVAWGTRAHVKLYYGLCWPSACNGRPRLGQPHHGVPVVMKASRQGRRCWLRPMPHMITRASLL